MNERQQDLLVWASHKAAVEECRRIGRSVLWWHFTMGGPTFVAKVKQLVAEAKHFSSREKHEVIQRFESDYRESVEENSHLPIDIPKAWTYSVVIDGDTVINDGRAQ